ncbi:MAG: glycosyltransferase [Lachnospiraceae bacterium]|nr:glycosyltransferase [Lachnospiraceae bacterium]
MKIMLISPNLCQGGFERVCVNTALILKPHYDVSIVLFDAAKIDFDIGDIKIIDLKSGVRKGTFAKLVNILVRAVKLRKVKQKHKPDVAYSFGATANIANALSKTKGTKSFLSLRSYMDIGEKSKIRLFIRTADQIICCSQGIADELKKRYSFNDAVVIYNPYDVAKMKRLAQSSEPEFPWHDENIIHIMSMGRDDDIKGYWHTIKIFYLVQEVFPLARLTILGDGQFSAYRKLAADLGISDKVYFAGMQKNPYQYLKKGTIYLLNSLMEGFPNALIEAMAMGMVPVACDCPTGPAEILLEEMPSEAKRNDIFKQQNAILGDYGILVPVMKGQKNLASDDINKDERRMATEVIKLLAEPELLAKYQALARKRADVFTNESYLKKLIGAIKDGQAY